MFPRSQNVLRRISYTGALLATVLGKFRFRRRSEGLRWQFQRQHGERDRY